MKVLKILNNKSKENLHCIITKKNNQQGFDYSGLDFRGVSRSILKSDSISHQDERLSYNFRALASMTKSDAGLGKLACKMPAFQSSVWQHSGVRGEINKQQQSDRQDTNNI